MITNDYSSIIKLFQGLYWNADEILVEKRITLNQWKSNILQECYDLQFGLYQFEISVCGRIHEI